MVSNKVFQYLPVRYYSCAKMEPGSTSYNPKWQDLNKGQVVAGIILVFYNTDTVFLY